MIPKRRYVRISGRVFLYQEKAPFEPSGKSVKGALEYSKDCDTVKCHECGLWFRALPLHIKKHRLTVRQYKLKHGLAIKTSLNSEALRETQISHGRRLNLLHGGSPFNDHEILKLALEASAKTQKRLRKQRRSMNSELLNLKRNCPAQLLRKIENVSDAVGHTPTYMELKESRVSPESIKHRFGSLSKAMVLVGLAPIKGRRALYNDTQLLSMLRNFSVRYGRSPSQSDCRRGLLPSKHTFHRRFGSWKRALRRAKLTVNSRQRAKSYDG
jgi:hypothetical protein